MRILRLIASANPTGGGPIEGLRLSTAEMAKYGHETEVATLDAVDAPFLSSVPFRVHALGPGLGKFRYTSRLSRWIVENGARFDVAVVHGLWHHSSVGGWHGLRRAGLPYVVFTHGMLDPWFRTTYPVKHLVKQAYWLLGQGKVLADAKAVLFTSEEELRLAHKAFWPYRLTPKVVAYGTTDPIRAVDSPGVFAALLPALGKRRYLLFMSRIHPKKGCDLLIEAFAKVIGRYPDLDLDLVIAGPDQIGIRAELAAFAEKLGIGDRIHWPGMLTGDAKYAAYKGAEAFVLPSHQENFGIVVAEAMACGTPVIISNKVNIWREVMASGGGLVGEDTADAMYELLQQFVSLNKAQREGMGLRARQGYQQHFGAENAAKDLEIALLEAQSAKAREVS